MSSAELTSKNLKMRYALFMISTSLTAINAGAYKFVTRCPQGSIKTSLQTL